MQLRHVLHKNIFGRVFVQQFSIATSIKGEPQNNISFSHSSSVLSSSDSSSSPMMESRLLFLLSQAKAKSIDDEIIHIVSKENLQIFSSSTNLAIFRRLLTQDRQTYPLLKRMFFALTDESQLHCNAKVILDPEAALSSKKPQSSPETMASSTSLTLSDWENMMVAADANNDHKHQQLVYSLFLESKANRTPSITLLNSLLSGGLSDHSKQHKSSEWIAFILNEMKTFNLPLLPQTIEIIMSHCVIHHKWDEVTSLLNPSLNLLPHFSLDLIQFLFYELGAAKLPNLVSLAWKLYVENSHSSKDLSSLHHVALDSILSSTSYASSLPVDVLSISVEIFSKLASSTSSIHPSTLFHLLDRLSLLLLKSTRFDLLYTLLTIALNDSQLSIPSSFFFQIFEGIIQYSQSFDRLFAFIAGLVNAVGPSALGPNVRAALIKLSARHHIPTTFMDKLERLEASLN